MRFPREPNQLYFEEIDVTLHLDTITFERKVSKKVNLKHSHGFTLQVQHEKKTYICCTDIEADRILWESCLPGPPTLLDLKKSMVNKLYAKEEHGLVNQSDSVMHNARVLNLLNPPTFHAITIKPLLEEVSERVAPLHRNINAFISPKCDSILHARESFGEMLTKTKEFSSEIYKESKEILKQKTIESAVSTMAKTFPKMEEHETHDDIEGAAEIAVEVAGRFYTTSVGSSVASKLETAEKVSCCVNNRSSEFQATSIELQRSTTLQFNDQEISQIVDGLVQSVSEDSCIGVNTVPSMSMDLKPDRTTFQIVEETQPTLVSETRSVAESFVKKIMVDAYIA